MSILINKNTTVLVQGITGAQGAYHTALMRKSGTKVVAGVTPGKGGQSIEGVPVYNTIKEAKKKHTIDWSCLFVPAPFVKNAAIEALRNDLHLVIITEHVPVYDMLEVTRFATERRKLIVGPNCPGIITPGECKIGIIPSHICSSGNVGIISRSGTLTYEILHSLTSQGIGQSTAVGMGGDPIAGIGYTEALSFFEKDVRTRAIVLIGEIGGDTEEKAAVFIAKKMRKPVVVYLAGRHAPPGKTMGHAGAIISGKSGTIMAKTTAFKKVNVPVALIPSQVTQYMKKLMKRS